MPPGLRIRRPSLAAGVTTPHAAAFTQRNIIIREKLAVSNEAAKASVSRRLWTLATSFYLFWLFECEGRASKAGARMATIGPASACPVSVSRTGEADVEADLESLQHLCQHCSPSSRRKGWSSAAVHHCDNRAMCSRRSKIGRRQSH